MGPRIEIRKAPDGRFDVRVNEGQDETRHSVRLKEDDYKRLTENKIGPEALIRLSFEFLLEHESNQSILPRFDLMMISRYFPHYESEIRRRIRGA